MKQITRYAAAYGIGAFAGIINELLVDRDHWAIVNPTWKVPIIATVGNIYGWSTVGATMLFDYAGRRGVNPWVQIVGATLVAVTIEGIAGQISKQFHNGDKKWHYPDSWIPLFGGYVSVVSTLYFGLGVALFYWLIFKPLLKV
ncbi:MAG: hypothetical protein P4L69_00060 [Desulfosporosinus sp.]|nr:hypothetical protein [Desulfosporosinus sp.]